jgi:hypothetical protein
LLRLGKVLFSVLPNGMLMARAKPSSTLLGTNLTRLTEPAVIWAMSRRLSSER